MMKKRLLSVLMAACALAGLLCTPALATEGIVNDTYKVSLTSYMGSFCKELVDGDPDTTWSGKEVGGADTRWVAFEVSDETQVKPTGYTLTLSQDAESHPERVPISWKLYGANYRSYYAAKTLLDEVTNDDTMAVKNGQTYSFTIDPIEGSGYWFYILEIYAVRSGSVVDLAEFQLVTCTHDWETTYTTEEATCTRSSYRVYNCKNDCGIVKREKIGEPLGHSYAEDPDSIVPPTCIKDGSETWLCTRCGGNPQVETLQATGHHYENGACKDCGLKQHIHYLCGGGTCTHTGDHTCTERTEFTPWEKTDSLPTESGNYFLNVDVTIGETWKPADGTQLCLNGHSIVQTSGTSTNQVTAITVEAGRTFTLTDCAAAPGTITHQSGAKSAGVLVSGGSFTMYGGKISGNTSRDTDSSDSNCGDGGGVILSGGSFTMYGGEISGNTAKKNGGGVCLTNSSSFTMHGGKISGNNASIYGGGVHVESGNGFTMEDGEISNNYAANSGGGIAAFGSINLTINNGKINGNTAERNGGGILLVGGDDNDYSTAKLYINNGEIRGNKVCYTGVGQQSIYGGGIRITRATVYMEDGRISENSIEGGASFYSSGAGVAVSGVFHMNGGEITNNTNGSTVCGGGGVYTDGTFYMADGTVSGNNVYGCGGGFMVYGALHMTGGTITGNSAWHGGGVYVVSPQTETINDQSSNNKISDSATGSMTVGGTAKITGNVRRGSKNAATGLYENTEENNVYLTSANGDRTITVLQEGEDALTTGAYISVCTQNLPTGETTIPITGNAPESSAFFHSDRPGYDIGVSETAVVLKVGRKVPTLSPNPVIGTYGSDITPSGTASFEEQDVPGTWSWKNGNAPKVVADSSSNGKLWYAVFTPDDAATYDSVTTEVTVTVNPKPLEVILKPANGRPLQGVTRVYQPDNYTVDLNGGGELSGVVYHGDVKDDVTMVHGTGTLTDNTPGSKPVTTNITLTGTDSVNYTIVQPTGVKVSIKQRTLSDAVVTLTPASIPFDGLPHAPDSVTVKVDGYTLTQGTDYTCTITPQTNAGTYTVTVETRPGSCYSDYATQTWKITNDSVAEPPVTVSYKLSTNYVTVSGLPKGVKATLIVVQYNGSQMVDVRVNTIDADIYFPPGTSFDETKGDSYKVFLLNSTGVPLCVATGAT